jgi:AraC-like DNA-binding protein
MESERCKIIVKNELSRLGLHWESVEPGEVVLSDTISPARLQLFDLALRNSGLELIEKRHNDIINKIKHAISQLVLISDDIPRPNISDYISREVNYDYPYLSNIFSTSEGITIEKYIIHRKIERVKELMTNSSISLSDIAFKLHFSSVAHLSNQFKKITGMTPSSYREHRNACCQKNMCTT